MALALLIGTFIFIDKRKSAAETADANARVAGMDVGQIVALEAELLACLYRHLTGVTVKVLAGEIHETPRLTRTFVQRLIDGQDVEIVHRPQTTSSVAGSLGFSQNADAHLRDTTTVRLTRRGQERHRHRPSEVRINVESGDYISNGPGGIVNNRSVNLHSPNIAGGRDPEMTAALTRLEEAVRASGNAGAIEQMDEFLVETRSAEPRPVVLRTLFTAIQQAVPAVAGMVDIAVKVRELWA